ncbi:hypothetical protein [uncultured Variovorax sp.]|uniref:hypothetical protein n=1 Tax=uncultured Variovorax sp. TaxID=114708 RepID=UPI0025E4A0B7|nr:hypothetical protein [uncultured Variovorax sp.]
MAIAANVVGYLKLPFGFVDPLSTDKMKEVEHECTQFDKARDLFVAAVLAARWRSNKKFEETVRALEEKLMVPDEDEMRQIEIDCASDQPVDKIIDAWTRKLTDAAKAKGNTKGPDVFDVGTKIRSHREKSLSQQKESAEQPKLKNQ